MPSIDYSFLKSTRAPDLGVYKVFVESGTFEGGTILAMEPHFDELFTIELDQNYFEKIKAKYCGSKITFLNGDTSMILPTILTTISKPTIFFLDGHWSGADTGRGPKDCPLLDEITAISNLYAPSGMIIVDDVRLFGTKLNEDWAEISVEKIETLLKDRAEKIYFLESEWSSSDRMVIHIKPLSGPIDPSRNL